MNPASTPSKASIDAQAVFESYLGNLPCAVFWKDLELVYRGGNAKFLALLGLSSNRGLLGKTEEDFVLAAEAERFNDIDRQVLETGEPILDREELVRIAGRLEPATLLTSRSPLKNSRGEIVGILGTYVDITHHLEVERKLVEQQNALEARNRAMEQDLQKASQIQKHLIGKEAPSCPFLDIGYRYRFMDKVGGDYISCRQLDDKDAYSFMLADLTGHGVTAALFMALLKYISKEAPDEVRALPAYFLSYLDMEFFGQIPDGFFTAFAATARHDEQAGNLSLEFTNAAHPAAILLRKDGTTEFLKHGEFAVGLLDFIERESAKTTLNYGDRLFVYSDGFIEAVDADGEEFGRDRFLDTLRGTRRLTLDEAIDFAFAAVDKFAFSPDPGDDMTLLVVEAKAPSAESAAPCGNGWDDEPGERN